MFFLGIDIAKLNHVASLVSDNGDIVFSNFMFKNSLEGFLSLKSIPKDDIVIALEFTGHYSDNFVNFFFNRKFNVTLVNPANVANFRKSYGRDSKNDRIDSINIAKMLISREYSLVTQSDTAYIIKSQAKSSVGFEDISLSFHISQLISSIELLYLFFNIYIVYFF